MTDRFFMFSPNPNAVAMKLKKSKWNYREVFNSDRKFKDDVGYSRIGVFPLMYEMCSVNKVIPEVDAMAKFLWAYVDPKYKDDKRAGRRAIKLVLDFYREMHTFGILSHNNAFEFVAYEKGLDLGYNVDFTTALQEHILAFSTDSNVNLGVQAMMRKNFGVYQKVKEKRRAKNGVKDWNGPIYELSNRHIKKVDNVSGVWLFTGAHIQELIDKMAGNNNRSAGIQKVLL